MALNNRLTKAHLDIRMPDTIYRVPTFEMRNLNFQIVVILFKTIRRDGIYAVRRSLINNIEFPDDLLRRMNATI